jgi:uroporphyrinogen decarboxylase
MTGKERIMKVLGHEKADTIPWVPFAGVHAAKVAGLCSHDVLTDANKLYLADKRVNEVYSPDGQPVMFDLQIEAEIYGCDLFWSEGNPPSVKSHPLAGTKTIPCLCKLPEKDDGRLPVALEATRLAKADFGKHTALYGLICGPFTLALHLRGNDIFTDMFDDEDYVRDLLEFTAQTNIRMADLYIDAGADIIAVVDPLVSQISPSHFERFCTGPFTKIFEHIKNKGVKSSFFVCGDATKNIENMCKTKPDSISIDENIDLAAAKKITDAYKVVIGGNIPLTSVMLYGTPQENMKYVIGLLDSVENKSDLIIAPGCDMPFAVPVENVIAVSQAIRETAEVRSLLENYESPNDDTVVELPDYRNLKRPLLEVFTLDSATCAACGYMAEAVALAKEHYGGMIDTAEYKITVKENISRIRKMGVKNLPSIYINGELKYSSIIPGRKEFYDLIDSYL